MTWGPRTPGAAQMTRLTEAPFETQNLGQSIDSMAARIRNTGQYLMHKSFKKSKITKMLCKRKSLQTVSVISAADNWFVTLYRGPQLQLTLAR